MKTFNLAEMQKYTVHLTHAEPIKPIMYWQGFENNSFRYYYYLDMINITIDFELDEISLD